MGHWLAAGPADRPMLADNSMDYFEFGFASDMPLNLGFVAESLCNQDVAAGSPCPAVWGTHIPNDLVLVNVAVVRCFQANFRRFALFHEFF